MSKFCLGLTAVFLSIINLFLSIFGLPKYPTFEIDMSKFNEIPDFCDEFNGDCLDKSVWSLHYTPDGTRRGSFWDIDMANVSDGKLTIKTQYLESGLKGKGAGWYTAGIDTSNSFYGKYGYYECRCILPAGYGHWSAFWLYCGGVGNVDGTGTDGAEIDIMESAYWGDPINQNSTIHTIHYDGYGEHHKSQNDGHWRIEGDPYNEFHTYGVEWNEKGYTFYIDGKRTNQTSFGGTSQVPEFMILSVELAGQNGIPKEESFAIGSIEDNEAGRSFASEFVVDYVRYYTYK